MRSGEWSQRESVKRNIMKMTRGSHKYPKTTTGSGSNNVTTQRGSRKRREYRERERERKLIKQLTAGNTCAHSSN